MNQDDDSNTYREWLQERRSTDAPEGFADRVMRDILQDGDAPLHEPPIWRSPGFWTKAAILTLAAIAGLGRYSLLVLCLFIE